MHNGQENPNSLNNNEHNNHPTLETYNNVINVIGNTANTAGHLLNVYNQIYPQPTVTRSTTTRREDGNGGTTEETTTTVGSLISNAFGAATSLAEPRSTINPNIICRNMGGAMNNTGIGLTTGTLGTFGTVAALALGGSQLAYSAYQWWSGSSENDNKDKTKQGPSNLKN